MNTRKIQRYVQVMNYMTRAEGVYWQDSVNKNGEVVVETVDPVRRIEKDINLPDHLGNNVDIII